MNKTVLGVTWLKLTANKFFIGLGIVIVLWGVIDSWLLNQRHPGIVLGNQNGNGNSIFILGPLTALTLFGIHRLILKTKMMLRGDSHQWNIFADLLPWFVWVAVGLATWGVNEWYHPRPLSMTSPWDWMASLLCVFVLGVLTLCLLSEIQKLILKRKMMFELPWFVWVVVALVGYIWLIVNQKSDEPIRLVILFFSLSLLGICFVKGVLGWWRTHQPPFLALASVGIATGLGCGFIGGVFGTAFILSEWDYGPFEYLFIGFLVSSVGLLVPCLESKFYVRNYIWIRYSFWAVMLSSVFLFVLMAPVYHFRIDSYWQTPPWFWSVPITGASVGLLGVLIFFNARSINLKTASKDEFMFFEQNPCHIRLKNQDNARCISLHLWWYRRRLTEWNPFWFTALVGIPLLSLFLISVPAVKDLQMIQQVFAEEGRLDYMSRIDSLDPAGMALKQCLLEREQSPDWKKREELFAFKKIVGHSFTPQTEGQLLLCQALNKEMDEISSKNSDLWSCEQQWDLLRSSIKDGPLSKQYEQKTSDLQAAKDAAFSKLMAYIWNQCSLGLGVGLVVDVMLLVGVAAWLNIMRSSKFPSSTQ